MVPSPVGSCRRRDIFILVQVCEPTIHLDEALDLAELFRLLGDPNRIRILYALAAADELCVHELAEAVEASETKVSQAMRLLRTAGAVRNRRDGRHVYYRLDDDHVRSLLDISRAHVAHGRTDP